MSEPFAITVSDAGAGVSDHSMRALARDQVAVMRELGHWVWSMLAAPAPTPEMLIGGAPAALVDHMLDSWSDDPLVFDAAIRDHYTATFREPDRVHTICEQYRAAAGADVRHDESDLGRNPIRCSTLVLRSATGAVDAWYEPLAIWRRWAVDVRGRAVDCGHFLPEEAPETTTSELLSFLA